MDLSRTTQKLIEAVQAKRLAEYVQRLRYGKIVDNWVGETVVQGGHSFLKDPQTGKLIPTISGAGSQSWTEMLDLLIQDGTQVADSAAETIICPDFNFPAYYLRPGTTFRVWSSGVMSNVVTTPGTLTMRARWGGVGGVQLLASGAQGLDTTAHTNGLWLLQALFTCRATGQATGKMMASGILSLYNLLASTPANLLPALLGSAGTPAGSGNVEVTIDTTVAKLFSLTAQFSVATSPTNLTCQQRVVEVLN